MNYRQTLFNVLGLLALVGITEAFYMRAISVYGLSEDPCGPSLALYRRLGVIAPAPPKQNTTTASPNVQARQPYMGMYQMMHNAALTSYDAADLPDLPQHINTGVMGAANPGGPGLLPPRISMECRCDSGIECQPLGGGGTQLPKFANECNRQLGLVCCCSTG